MLTILKCFIIFVKILFFMDKEIVNKIINQVFREKSLIKKICKSSETCSGCGLCPLHNPLGVLKVLDNGAERISTGLGIQDGEIKLSNIAGMIDHTLLKPDATESQISELCNEAKSYSFATVCINPVWVSFCSNKLLNTKVKVCTVVGFPLGASITSIKVMEAKKAIEYGAREIDMVINIGKLKSKDYDYVYNDINQIALLCKTNKVILKVIIEACLLSDEEKIIACMLSKDAGADFVKTSTGFSTSGATVGDVALMRKVVGSAVGVKAAGGIRTYDEAVAMIESGADRIGASASVKIVSTNQ
jgi:deoxyribose-phosphate aldolase